MLSTSPWILHFQSFATADEAAALLGAFERIGRGFRPSLITREDGSDGGATTIRSSASMWCDKPVCYESPIVQRLTQRLSGLLQTSASNAEAMQLLRYNAGDEYKVHHDFSGPADAGASGGRVYSFVLFLSTPEAGGGTRFADLGRTVPAIKGNAVLWPSVTDDDPDIDEPMTNHEGTPPDRGIKYAANVWVHMYDYRTPASQGCPMSFKNTH